MGVLVLGMHRGGTSALTGLLHLLGFDAGPDEALIGATEANPRGHWELEPLRAFNDELLAELGGRWSAPPPATTAALEALADGEWGARARRTFEGLLPGDRWVWKDPRVCLLLPFWRRVLGPGHVVVATVRHPVEVARSLEVRDALSLAYSLALWERHQRRAMLDSSGMPTFVVSYEDLLDRPAEVAGSIAAFLGDHGHEVARGVDRAGAFVDAAIRRHREEEALDGCADATAEQVALHAEVVARLGDRTSDWGEGLPPETPGLQLAFDEHARMARWADLSDQLRAGIDEVRAAKDAERDAVLASLAKVQGWLDDSRAETALAWGEVRRLEVELADAIEGRIAVVAALERVIEERDGWKWTVLQYEEKPLARARRSVRRAVVGEDP